MMLEQKEGFSVTQNAYFDRMPLMKTEAFSRNSGKKVSDFSW